MADERLTPAAATILREVEKAIEEEEQKKVDITPTVVDITANTVEQRIQETKSPVFKKKKKKKVRRAAPVVEVVQEQVREPIQVSPEPETTITREPATSKIKRELPVDEQAELLNLQRDIREFNLMSRDVKDIPIPLQDFEQQQALQRRRESIIARLDINRNVQRTSDTGYAIPGSQDLIIESLDTTPATLISGIEPRLTEFFPFQQTRPTVPLAPETPDPLTVIAAPPPSIIGKALASPVGQLGVGLAEATPLVFVPTVTEFVKEPFGTSVDPLRSEGIPVKLEPLPGQFFGETAAEKEKQKQLIESIEAQEFLTKERQLGRTIGAIADIALLPGDEFSQVLTRQKGPQFEGLPRTTGIEGDIRVSGRARRIGETRALELDPTITTEKPSVFLDYTETGFGPAVKTRVQLKPDKTIIKTQTRDSSKYITTQQPGDKFSTTQVYKKGKLKKTITNPPLTSEKTIVDSVIRTKPEVEVLTTPEGLLTTQRSREISEITQPLGGRKKVTGLIAQEDVSITGTRPGIRTTIKEKTFVKDDLISTLREGVKLEEPPLAFKGEARKGKLEFVRTEQKVGDDFIQRETVFEAIPQTRFETDTEIKGRLRIEQDPLPPLQIEKIRGKKAEARSLFETLGKTTVTRRAPAVAKGIELPLTALRPTGNVLDLLTATTTPIAVSRLRQVGLLQPESKSKVIGSLKLDTKREQELGAVLEKKATLEAVDVLTLKRRAKSKGRRVSDLAQMTVQKTTPITELEAVVTPEPTVPISKIIIGSLPGLPPLAPGFKPGRGSAAKGKRNIKSISRENFLRNLYSDSSPRARSNINKFL